MSSPGISFVTIQASAPMNGNWINVFKILNVPCAKAICILFSRFKTPEIHSTYIVNGVSRIIKMTVPIKLNNTCVAAARRAATLAPNAARMAVIVVPILSPNSTGSAPCSGIRFSAYKPCKIPTVADDD